MPFAFYERISLFAATALPLIAIALTGDVSPLFWGAAMAALGMGAWLHATNRAPWLPLATLPTIAAVIFFGVDVRYLADNVLMAVIDLVLLLLAMKLVGGRTVRDNLQVLGLGFLLLLAATVVTVEASFGLLFLLYVFVGLWALVMQNLRGHWESAGGDWGALARRKGVLGRAFGLAIFGLGAGILAFTLVVYLLFPRVGIRWWRGPGLYESHVTGFNDRVELGGGGEITMNPAIALRVRFREGRVPDDPGVHRWRGAVMDSFDGRTWRSNPAPGLELMQVGRSVWQVAQGQVAWEAEAWPAADYGQTLFVPQAVLWIKGDFKLVQKNQPGNLLFDCLPRGKPSYSVGAAEAGMVRERPDPPPRALTEVPVSLSPRIRALARVWAGPVQGEALAARLATHLVSQYRYTLDNPASQDATSPVEDFLFRTHAGHCELFASSLAMLLRLNGIPARLVSGYAGGDTWGDDSLVFRELNAHSWVEAWFPGTGWREYDPTPPTPPALGFKTALLKRLYDVTASLKIVWGTWFVDYDFERQATAAHEFRDAGLRWGQRLRLGFPKGFSFPRFGGTADREGRSGSGFLVLLALAGVTLLGWLGLRNRAGGSDAILVLYRKLLRKAERALPRKPGETPLAFSRRLAQAEERWRGFDQCTETYYALRFGRYRPEDLTHFVQLAAGLARKKGKKRPALRRA